MRIDLDRNVSLTDDAEGNVYVTRPDMYGKLHTHSVKATYPIQQVATWLNARISGKRNKMVQDEFPDMSKEDREFLLTGITPQEWNRIFKGDK